mmetsp:Transcript_41712/g.107996  ORF Transcript_41712/g.107996 Transcript_41712/m.107996 type:complete len:333 (+) Transcript_41712:398-1396(+)
MAANRLTAWVRSSGETSSVPRARLNRQYTSCIVSMPPARSTGLARKSDSWRDSSLWYDRPAVSLVTGDTMPRSISSSSIAICASPSSPAMEPSCRRESVDRKRSASDTSSIPLCSSALRSEKASLSTESAASASCCCRRRMPVMPAPRASSWSLVGAASSRAMAATPSSGGAAPAPTLPPFSSSQLMACCRPVLPVMTSACAESDTGNPIACICPSSSASAWAPGVVLEAAVSLSHACAEIASCTRVMKSSIEEVRLPIPAPDFILSSPMRATPLAPHCNGRPPALSGTSTTSDAPLSIDFFSCSPCTHSNGRPQLPPAARSRSHSKRCVVI